MLIFYASAALLIWLGILSLRGGFRFRAFVKRENSRPKSDFAPFASIIAPCRGLDQGLRENLAALFHQNYELYEVIFVVDDERDASLPIIKSVLQTNAKIVVAGRAADSSQKVHNLSRAVLEVATRSKVLVFVDSDARPDAEWLRRLVSPLCDETVGAATGYRWFISKKGNFASELRAVWNASIASALGANGSKNFCWGGATAIRREIFDSLEILKKWRGAASDDFALTNALQKAKLPIHFVPDCLTASIEDCNFRELLEFTTRQMKITSVYAPHLWRASLVGSFLFTTIFWTGVILMIWRAIDGFSFWLPLAFLIVIFALGAGKAWLRLKAVQIVLPDYKKELKRQTFWQITLWTITPAVYFYNSVCAAFSREILWRGILYELKSPYETVVK